MDAEKCVNKEEYQSLDITAGEGIFASSFCLHI